MTASTYPRDRERPRPSGAWGPNSSPPFPYSTNWAATLTDVAQITIRGALVLVRRGRRRRRASAIETISPRWMSATSCARVSARTWNGHAERRGARGATAGDAARSFDKRRRLDTIFATFARTSRRANGSCTSRATPLTVTSSSCAETDHAGLREDLASVAKRVGLDLAVQRAGLHRRAKHLVVMDADSTLLQDEVIDLLADACGCAKEVVGDHRSGHGR